MSYKLSFQKEAGYLRVNVIGERTRESVTAIAWDVLRACTEEGNSRVLVDVRQMTGRLNRVDAYDVTVLEFPKIQSAGILKMTAIVDLEEYRDRFRFFETVAINRGFNLRIFGDPDEAVIWLCRA